MPTKNESENRQEFLHYYAKAKTSHIVTEKNTSKQAKGPISENILNTSAHRLFKMATHYQIITLKHKYVCFHMTTHHINVKIQTGFGEFENDTHLRTTICSFALLKHFS